MNNLQQNLPRLRKPSNPIGAGRYNTGVSEITDTLDYRDLLQEAYEQRKADNPLYSYRLMAGKLGLNVSHLYRILRKDLHLSLDKVP